MEQFVRVAPLSLASDTVKQVSSRTMERRKAPRKDWVITKDDIGRSVLEWKVDYRATTRATKRQESDPLARTYNFLKCLDVPNLELQDERSTRVKGRNPYDTGTFPAMPKTQRR